MSLKRRRRRAATLLFLAAPAMPIGVLADNLACSGTGMDWYTTMVGETPCAIGTTYQRLRQICNSQYTVGVQNVNTPPDACNDQLWSCCCNNVAFALSMLCLNCQQDIGTGTGYDAGTGAYQDYLGSCSPVEGLSTDIQTAVCNEGIKIDDDLYTNGWSDGACIYSRDTIIKDNIVANNNSFTHCASTTLHESSSPLNAPAPTSVIKPPSSTLSQSSTSLSTAPSSSPTSSPTVTATSSSSSSNNSTTGNNSLPAVTPITKLRVSAGVAAGSAIGGLFVIGAVLGGLWWYLFVHRRRQQGVLKEPLNGSMGQRYIGRAGEGNSNARLMPAGEF
ncbi:hypothetical protein C8F01DRAFT_1003196 [Mycena amicta]|nr:hypothetical protein C8F01DRAFT_1003196 [Mycena amicta]